jgi:hypothetical protein
VTSWAIQKPLRILHLPDVVGGHAPSLARGECELGAHARSLSFVQTPFNYRANMELRYSGERAGKVRRWAERIAKFARIRGSYDVFHFNFGNSLLNAASGTPLLADLPFYPKRSAKLMTWQGSDLRFEYPPVLEESFNAERRCAKNTLVAPTPMPDRQTQLRRRRARDKSLLHCDYHFALNPDLMDELPSGQSQFLPYALALDIESLPPLTTSANALPLHVVHLSTNRVLKGTALIENALAQAAEQFGITYEVHVRIPRDEALAKIASADLIVDQMVLGWYGGLATEAMAMGKPVICRINDDQLAKIDSAMATDLPIVRSRHDNLAETIGKLQSDRECLDQLAKQGRDYVSRWHMPSKVAAITLAKYNELLARGSDPHSLIC